MSLLIEFKKLKRTGFIPAVLIGGVLAGIILAVSSGLMTIYFPDMGFGNGFGWGMPTLSEDSIMTLGIILLLIATIIGIVALIK